MFGDMIEEAEAHDRINASWLDLSESLVGIALNELELIAAKIAKVFRRGFDEVLSGFYACDMRGAGLKSSKAPSAVVAGNVEDALSGNCLSVGVDDGPMAFVQPVREGRRFAGLEELWILVEETRTDVVGRRKAASSPENHPFGGVADLE